MQRVRRGRKKEERGPFSTALRDSRGGKNFISRRPPRNSLHKTVGDIRARAATWNGAIRIKNTRQRQN